MDYKPDTLPTQLICHSLQVSDFKTLKSHALLNLQMIQVSDLCYLGKTRLNKISGCSLDLFRVKNEAQICMNILGFRFMC